MAEQIPFGVAVNLITKLASSAFHELGQIYGVMGELEKLKQTLESIQVVLSDAERRRKDPCIEHWIRRFKEVLHDADDLLDDLTIKELQDKVNDIGTSKIGGKVRGFFSSEKSPRFRKKLASKIENIRKKFNDVAEDMSNLNLNQSPVILNQNVNAGRETDSYVLRSTIIGREESENEIIDLIKQTHTDHGVSLIAIVGMGGLGKTVLAKLVYNYAQEHQLYEKYMWLCISEDFEVKTILNKMLKSLKGKGVGDLELDLLQQKIRQELSGQRYMLVMDDVWNECFLKWDDLRTYLMCGGQGSKILVTTRSTNVSQIMGVKNPYVLKGLTKEHSWALLKKVILGEDARIMNPNLELIGAKIAEKCGGVPLAIKTIGGYLRTIDEDSDQWSSILNDDIWRLCEERDSVMPVLKLSYQKLPPRLRQCFAYCCLYPKDWRIRKDELIQFWMAQGYLESSTKWRHLEDVGNQYVKILLMRSFLQDASMNQTNNDIESFEMHDLMHDLATYVAGNDCYLYSEGQGIVGRPMHLSFLSSTVCSLDSLDASRLRTLLLSRNETKHSVKQSTVKNMKHLRILDLSCSSVSTLFIDKFKHLRFLGLTDCDKLTSLPDSLGNLVCLQTLKLNGCKKLVFSIKIITKLVSLRHLDIDGCKAFEDMIPAGLGKLTSLQYLSKFVVGGNKSSKSAKLNELKELNDLRGTLTICGLGLVQDVMFESQEVNMKAKKYIQSLQLLWSGVGHVENKKSDSLQLLDNLCPHQDLRELSVAWYPGVRFSSWLLDLTNIVQIDFSDFPNYQNLPPLEKLLHLKSLHIQEMPKLEVITYEEISDVFFPSLKTLLIKGCRNLKGWQRLGDDNKANCLPLPPFPRLYSLEIRKCPNLTCMPTFPHLVHGLILGSCSVKPLIETCMVQLESSSCCPLSSLEHLEILEEIEIEALPTMMQNLKSLKSLDLRGSSIIPPILRQLKYLPAQLKTLRFWKVDKLDLWEDETDVSTHCHTLPHCLRSLENISIWHCHNMKVLPEWIRDLQSLRFFSIIHCHQLQSLPDAMRHLTNLEQLQISNCPLLRDRCQNETGQDWIKIAHIPHIYIFDY